MAFASIILCVASLLLSALAGAGVWLLGRRLKRAKAQVNLARELLHRHLATPHQSPNTEAELKELRADVRGLEEIVNAIAAEIAELKSKGATHEHGPLERQANVLRFRLAALEDQLARLHLIPEHRLSTSASESLKAA